MQSRCETGYLIVPVQDQRGRHHNQLGTLLGTTQQQGDGLECLAQTHIVGQQSTGSPMSQTTHPLVTLFLVGTQICLDLFRDLDVQLFRLLHAIQQRLEVGIRFYLHTDLLHLLQRHRIEGRYTHLAPVSGGNPIQQLQLFPQIAADPHILLIVQLDKITFRLIHSFQQVGQLHANLIAEGYLTRHLKPVGDAANGETERRGLQGRQAHPETFTLRPLHNTLFRHFPQAIQQIQTISRL